MIRRDYLLRAIEQCVQAISRSLALIKQAQFDQAHDEIAQAIHTLTGQDALSVSALSETELIALLLDGGPTQLVRQKCMLLVALLRQTGDAYAGQGNTVNSRRCYLKALNLQIEMLLREGPFECPEYVPRLDSLVTALGPEPLPLRTSAGLMRHYESIGEFAKAEDALFAMLDAEPGNPSLQELGLQFYDRLLRQSDDALACGNLPRSEAVSGRAELQRRAI